jgi:hypothetical protein
MFTDKHPKNEWARLMQRVHGAQAMVAIPFALATRHNQHIRQVVGGFPILYLHGGPATGKTSMARGVQMGFAPHAIIHGRSERLYKAVKARKDAFTPFVLVLEEYCFIDPGVSAHDEALQQELNAANEGLPLAAEQSAHGMVHYTLNGSVVVTSQQPPMNPQLLTRIVSLELTPRKHDHDLYNRLSYVLATGVRSVSGQEHAEFSTAFEPLYHEAQKAVEARTHGLHHRNVMNLAILLATMRYYGPALDLAFNDEMVLAYLVELMQKTPAVGATLGA